VEIKGVTRECVCCVHGFKRVEGEAHLRLKHDGMVWGSVKLASGGIWRDQRVFERERGR
jgi:hypothetical protein